MVLTIVRLSCLWLFLGLSWQADSQDLFSRPPTAKSFLSIDASLPTTVAGTAGGVSLVVTGEVDPLPVDWNFGVAAFRALLNDGSQIQGMGIETGVETNFRSPVEPLAGLSTAFSLMPDANNDSSFGIKPYVGVRTNLFDSLVVSVLLGDYFCLGGNSPRFGNRSNEVGSGLVLGLRFGWSLPEGRSSAKRSLDS